MRVPRSLIVAAAAGLTVAFASPAGASATTHVAPPAARLQYTTVDAPIAGAWNTNLNGVNNLGVMSGQYNDASGVTHGFIMAGHHFITVDVPWQGTVYGTAGNAINDWGTQVGIYYDSSSVWHAYLRPLFGVITTIDDPLGVNGSSAWGINDQGVVVGYYTDINGLNHGFLCQNGHFTTVNAPGAGTISTGAGTALLGINNHGVATGDVTTDGDIQSAFTYNTLTGQFSPTFTAPGDPGGGVYPGGTQPLTINDAGVIVGFAAGSAAESGGWFTGLGFRLVNGHFTSVSDPLAQYAPVDGNVGGTFPYGINDHGTVVGWYVDSVGLQHGFVAYPTS